MDTVPGLFLAIFAFAFFCFWVYCFIDILTSEFKGNEKLLWAVVVLLAPVLGLILYLILGKRSKIRRRRFDPYQKRRFDD